MHYSKPEGDTFYTLDRIEAPAALTRRQSLRLGAALGAMALARRTAWAAEPAAGPQAAERGGAEKQPVGGEPTKFLTACMTLPYSQFPLQRALEGIKAAGYEYVAWGTTHQEQDGGRPAPVMPADAPPARAKELGQRCRDLGLEPLMMFSEIYPEDPQAPAVFASRIQQAAAAGIGQVLTFGHTKGGNRKLWVERFQQWGPVARDHGVMIVVKQHGGETGTGAACAQIVREVDDDGIKVNYDAGNVMDYLHLDPLPDIQQCADQVHSFCIKDHRTFPTDGDCGPGFGEIDHYRLLAPVAHLGRVMPLCCENIFAPVVGRPSEPDGIDALARRAREFLEVVVQGLQTQVDA